MPCDAADLPSFAPPTNVSYLHTVLLCDGALPALMETTGSTDAVAVGRSQEQMQYYYCDIDLFLFLWPNRYNILSFLKKTHFIMGRKDLVIIS